jgi:hypothetical protein
LAGTSDEPHAYKASARQVRIACRHHRLSNCFVQLRTGVFRSGHRVENKIQRFSKESLIAMGLGKNKFGDLDATTLAETLPGKSACET